MSCGTCPTSAQPTTHQDGTASTPGTLLWSANVGEWYRRQRAQGQRPVVQPSGASSAPAAAEPDAAAAAEAAWRERAREAVVKIELGLRLGNAAQDPARIVAWTEPPQSCDPDTPSWQRPVVWFLVHAAWGNGNSTNRYYATEDGDCYTAGEGAKCYASPEDASAALEEQSQRVRASAASLLLCPRCGEELRDAGPACAQCAGRQP